MSSERRAGLPDGLHSNDGRTETFWDGEPHCLLSSKVVSSCLMVCCETMSDTHIVVATQRGKNTSGQMDRCIEI